MKTRILLITDSLSLPRVIPEIVLYEETYLTKCIKEFPTVDFISIQIGAADITTLYNQLFYYKAVKPDLVIVQSGIVDCAPRAFSPIELAVLNSSSTIKTLSKKLLKPIIPFLRKHRRTTSTTLNKFQEFVDKFIVFFDGTPVYWMSIIPGTDGYEKQVPGIKRNIEAYNVVLKNKLKSNYIDYSNIDASALMSDHHHLNAKGHELVFDKLKNLIAEFLKK